MVEGIIDDGHQVLAIVSVNHSKLSDAMNWMYTQGDPTCTYIIQSYYEFYEY